MSNFVIKDLAFLDQLDSQASTIDGGASAGAAAAANYNDAVATGAATTDGNVYARANGSFSNFRFGGFSGPSVSVNTEDPYYYYY